jgi:hypothetical protein
MNNSVRCVALQHNFGYARVINPSPGESSMLKAALVGAFLFVAANLVPAVAGEVSEGQIAQAKAVLNLTPEQERYWPRVASAIRSFSRDSARVENGEATTTERMKLKLVGAKRVVAAAMPLVKSMTAEQKQTAVSMVRMMGYGSLAAKL